MDYPKVKVCLDTSEDNLIDELYTPCLKWAERFDRGVGYFTTGWLTYNVAGLSDFASRGGKMRLITSPILSTEDTDVIIGQRAKTKALSDTLRRHFLTMSRLFSERWKLISSMRSLGCCTMELSICALQFRAKSWRKETFTTSSVSSTEIPMLCRFPVLSTTADTDFRIMKA